MATKAKLSHQEVPEGEERLLEDTVFPFLFGHGSEPDVPRGPIVLQDDLDGSEPGETTDRVARNAKRCHDLFLWYQGIGTPYGYYQYQALRAQSRLLQSACLRIATRHQGFEFLVPIFPWYAAHDQQWADAARSGSDSSGAATILVKSMRTWTSLDRGIGILAGTAATNLRSVRAAMVLLHKWLGAKDELAIALHQGASPDEPACPLEAGLPIGGNSIMATSARAAGFLYALRLEDAAKASGQEVDLSSLFKGNVFDLRTLAMFDEKLVGRRPDSEAELLTFLAASDLALFTPLHPCFARLRTGMRWNDFHPGHRFRRILEVIRERDLQLKEPDPWAYWRFTASISEALKWPEVPRFLDAARAKLDKSDDDLLVRIFRSACEARESDPCSFIDPFVSVEQLGHIAPPFLAASGDEGEIDADRALFFAIEGELYALGFQLLFSQKAPSFILDSFEAVRGLLDSPPEMVKSYFGLDLEE